MQNGNGRLSSWKEIAGHFGKDVRTVQRWEAELGLPVHRVAGKKRELVFAFEHELDDWMRSSRTALNDPAEKQRELAEASPPITQPTDGTPQDFTQESLGLPMRIDPRGSVPTRKAIVVGLATAGLLALGFLFGRGLPLFAGDAQPAEWRVEGYKLQVLNKQGRVLWQHSFKRPIDVAAYSRVLDHGQQSLVQFVDLDGDGSTEVLFIYRGATLEAGSFFCFNSDGSVRFSRRPGRVVRFGKKVFDARYATQFAYVTANGDGPKTIWLGGVHFWEASVLEKLGPQGDVLGEFWHSGHIQSMQEASHNGRRVVLAGYVRNENRGASLAVIDYENPTGAAPSENEDYACSNCPEGQPLAFFTFPQMELSRVANSMPRVELINPEENGEIAVTVRQTDYYPAPEKPAQSIVVYVLDSDLNVTSGKVPISYEQVHALMEATGSIKHRYSPTEAKELFPVRRWINGKVESVYAPFSNAEPVLTQSHR